jgi:hypothetical protein
MRPRIAPLGRRQRQQTQTAEFAQPHLGTGKGRPPIGREPSQMATHLARQDIPAWRRRLGHHLAQTLDALGTEDSATDNNRLIHPAIVPAESRNV